ncbi:hypothetical protein MAPG_05355 [Magnaporthiopsis poae ATCC 64411]|uniref:DUF6536 domain-containing protein n=1 Tax=Magnaporthiopsis poae (strain ATCC 64411 / 73-15) TaxID=644358 RepID=A0A0C4DZ66_MAGP6|nr:hypothetical protein MAPG_05355 [Magnaporthiopsis poae ATCC 64411]
MEVVIPPRDHGATTYRYEWDENGAVTNISRVAPEERTGSSGLRSRAGSNSQNSHKKTHNHGRSRGARQTVQWPFQSTATITTTTVTETATPVSPVVPMSAFHNLRRATWQIPGSNRIRDSQYTVDPTIVPDYVANFIRGETPETLARKKNDSRTAAQRGVDVVTPDAENRGLRSRAAAFDGFPDLDIGDGMHSFNSNSRLVDCSGNGNGGQLEAGTGSSRRRGGCLGRFTNGGWRSGVELNALLALLVFVVGLACLIWAVASSKLLAGGADAVVFAGSCDAASRVNWGLHALANVLGLALLAGANYVYQVLGTGLVALLAVLVVLAAGTLGLGLRRAPAAVMVNGQALGNPLVLDAGSCSAVVSARCHPLRTPEGGVVADEEDADLDERPLCWGVVRQTAGMVVSHCTYSARGVERLDMSRAYA